MKAKDLAAKLLENPESDVFTYSHGKLDMGIVYDICGAAVVPNKIILIQKNSSSISKEEEHVVNIAFLTKR